MILLSRMKTTILRYQVLIKKEGKHYVAYVPSLGISDFGKSVDEVRSHVQGVIKCHVEGLVKTGAVLSDTKNYFFSPPGWT